ncbi:MAG: SOS response-associated peptidase [Chloroflexi bacterium]|nr:SOS response-associated peptidase [Chloroflexota bacterium]MCI0825200.1 SOS response-associated peptidase [Chloroflexota bacterium]
MCGRFTLTSNMDDLQGRFGFEARDLVFRPSYNIAPTQLVLAVTNDGQRRAELMRWGLVPFWAKDIKIGYRMINAVGETAATKPAFRAAFKKRRCLILADGFFEWRKDGKEKIPTYIFLKSQEPFAFAGLWETWKSPAGETVKSCTILTTKPNEFMEPIHNRMPVILSGETEALWLDPMTEEPDVLQPLIQPAPAELMESRIVSSLVNSPKNNSPECVVPITGGLPGF